MKPLEKRGIRTMEQITNKKVYRQYINVKLLLIKVMSSDVSPDVLLILKSIAVTVLRN